MWDNWKGTTINCYCSCPTHLSVGCSFPHFILRSLSNDDGDFNENNKKTMFRLTKQQLCRCIMLFCTISLQSLHDYMFHVLWRTWICKLRQRLPFSFPELQYSLLEFNSRKNCQRLTNWMRWNKSDKVWSSLTLLFKWHSRSRHYCCCLSSPLYFTEAQQRLSTAVLETWYKN